MGGEPHENLLHVKPPTRPPAAPAGGGCCSHDTSSTLYTTHRIVPTLHQQQQPHRWPSHAHARAHTSCSCTPPPPAPPPPPARSHVREAARQRVVRVLRQHERRPVDGGRVVAARSSGRRSRCSMHCTVSARASQSVAASSQPVRIMQGAHVQQPAASSSSDQPAAPAPLTAAAGCPGPHVPPAPAGAAPACPAPGPCSTASCRSGRWGRWGWWCRRTPQSRQQTPARNAQPRAAARARGLRQARRQRRQGMARLRRSGLIAAGEAAARQPLPHLAAHGGERLDDVEVQPQRLGLRADEPARPQRAVHRLEKRLQG